LLSQKWNHYCTNANSVIYTAPRYAHSATFVVPLLCAPRAPPRPLANKALPLATTALVNLTIGAPGAPKPEAIAVLNLTLPDPIASISFSFLFFCCLTFRPFF